LFTVQTVNIFSIWPGLPFQYGSKGIYLRGKQIVEKDLSVAFFTFWGLNQAECGKRVGAPSGADTSGYTPVVRMNPHLPSNPNEKRVHSRALTSMDRNRCIIDVMIRKGFMGSVNYTTFR